LAASKPPQRMVEGPCDEQFRLHNLVMALETDWRS